MSSKLDYKGSDSKDSKNTIFDEDDDTKGEFSADAPEPPNVNILSVAIDPQVSEISQPVNIAIKFELDRDCVAAYWTVKFLVDSADQRIVRV